jgi:hypothetical protein
MNGFVARTGFQRMLTLCALATLAAPKIAAVAAATPAIQGQARLSVEHQKTLKETATLYVIARKPGEPVGPPLAVKRIAPPLKFPVDFSISASDVMMPGQKFEGNIALTARVSQSGSAMPISPGDIEGAPAARFVPIGTQGVVIELNRVRR